MMSTARLKNVYQQEQRQRKFVCVMNDVAKTKQDRYDHFIDTEKAEATQRNKKAIDCTRRNIVRQRVLKKCMQNKREEVEKKQASTMFGKYHGVSVEHIAGEIDTYLQDNHPRIRRAQKINDLFQEGYENGAILDKETVKRKVKRFFDKPLVELHKIQEVDETSSKASPCLPPLGRSFYTSSYAEALKSAKNNIPPSGETVNVQIPPPENEDNKLFVKRKVSKFLTEHVPDDFSVLNEDQNVQLRKEKAESRPLTLPPIKIGTDNNETSKPAKGSIAELAAKFAKSKEKTEKLQRRLMQGQSPRKHHAEKIVSHNGSKQPGSRRPKSDGIDFKQTNIELKKLKVRKVDRDDSDGNDEDILSFSLPPIKFKSSSKRL